MKKRFLTALTILSSVSAVRAADASAYEGLKQALLNILQTIASFGGALTSFSEVDKNLVWFFSIAIGIVVFTIIYWSIIQHGNFLGSAEQRRRPALIISLLAGIGATLLIPTATYEQVLFFIKNGLVQLTLGLAIPAGAYAAYRAMSENLERWGMIGFARILLGIAIAGGNAFLDKFTTEFRGIGGEIVGDKLIIGALPWIGTLSAILSIITIGLFINGIYRIVTDILPEGARNWVREELGRSGVEMARTQEQRREIITHENFFRNAITLLREHVNNTAVVANFAQRSGPSVNVRMQGAFGITGTQNPEPAVRASATNALNALEDFENVTRRFLEGAANGRFNRALFSRDRRRTFYDNINDLRGILQEQQGNWWREPTIGGATTIRQWFAQKMTCLNNMNRSINFIERTIRGIIQEADRRLTQEERDQARQQQVNQPPIPGGGPGAPHPASRARNASRRARGAHP